MPTTPVPRLELFAERLKHALAAKGWLQVDLARAVGVSKASVTRWLGGAVPDIERLVQVAEAVDQDWLWLVGADGTGAPSKRAAPVIDPRVVRRLIQRLVAVAEDARAVASKLPDSSD